MGLIKGRFIKASPWHPLNSARCFNSYNSIPRNSNCLGQKHFKRPEEQMLSSTHSGLQTPVDTQCKLLRNSLTGCSHLSTYSCLSIIILGLDVHLLIEILLIPRATTRPPSLCMLLSTSLLCDNMYVVTSLL